MSLKAALRYPETDYSPEALLVNVVSKAELAAKVNDPAMPKAVKRLLLPLPDADEDSEEARSTGLNKDLTLLPVRQGSKISPGQDEGPPLLPVRRGSERLPGRNDGPRPLLPVRRGSERAAPPSHGSRPSPDPGPSSRTARRRTRREVLSRVAEVLHEAE